MRPFPPDGAAAGSGTGADRATGSAATTYLVDPGNDLAGGIAELIVYDRVLTTANGIAEVALVNQATGTQTVAPASATIARALLSPVVNKGASDTLAVTWHHDLLGAAA